MRTTVDEPDDDLPAALRSRLAAFPVHEIVDDVDRRAAIEVELELATRVLVDLGIDAPDIDEVMDRYVHRLHERLEAPGRRRTPPSEVHVIDLSRAGQLRRRAGGLLATASGPLRNAVSGVRVDRRERRWRRLLA